MNKYEMIKIIIKNILIGNKLKIIYKTFKCYVIGKNFCLYYNCSKRYIKKINKCKYWIELDYLYERKIPIYYELECLSIDELERIIFEINI